MQNYPQSTKMMTTTEPTILDKEPSAQAATQPHSQPSKTNTLPGLLSTPDDALKAEPRTTEKDTSSFLIN